MPEEKELLDTIDLRDVLPPDVDGHAVYKSNREPIIRLLKLLVERKAIPERRIAYWTDPRHFTGRSKASHRGIFERNGSKGNEAYTHPHFLPFLRFFLFGASLPQAAIDEFETCIGNPEWFSGSDILRLTKKTREIVRRYNLKDYDAADEFHKLAIDNGLSIYNALSVHKAAREAARR